MGMAASQVRFLTLQDRKSTIGMRLGVLSNRKMALTRDMNKAAEAYNEAYSNTKLQWYDSINGRYTDITYNAMMSPNAGNSYTPYVLTDRNTGKVILDGQTLVSTLCDSQNVSGTNMVDGMERIIALGNYTPATYKAGLMSYDELTMAPIIIKDIMGITSFDKDKMIYEGVKNKDISIGGYQKLVHSDIMAKMNVGVGNTLPGKTSRVVPVWEIYDSNAQDFLGNSSTSRALMGAVSCTYDLYSGEYRYVVDNLNHRYDLDHEGNYSSFGSGMYLDASGNAHSLKSDTYWKTLYESGAVIINNYSVDTGEYYGISYSSDIISYNSSADSSIKSSNIYSWVSNFVTAVNDKGILKYDMTGYLDSISMATTRHLRDTYKDSTNKNVNNLYTRISKTPDKVEDYNIPTGWAALIYYNEAGTSQVNKSVWKERHAYEFEVYSTNDNDPVGNDGMDNIGRAIAQQANATTSVINYNAVEAQYVYRNQKDVEAKFYDTVQVISVKNVMDVALYYIRLTQEKLAAQAQTDNPDAYAITTDSLYNIGKDEFGYTDYATNNNPEYSDPSNYNQGEMEVWEQGETKVASVRSMLSNLEMLDEKIGHYDSKYGDTYAGAWAWVYDGNTYGGYPESGLKKLLTDILNNGYNSNKSHAEAQLIALANINAWMCEALSQDCSTQDGYNRMVEYCKNIWKDISILWDGGFQESTWDETQTGATWSQPNSGHENSQGNPQYFEGQFYYDDGVAWDRRSQLFSQDSIDRTATKRLDIEGQLNTLQLHQFKFYVNLVKECLARGWNNHNGPTTSLDDKSVSLHLQNGTWLINDNMAKSSSRVFEVADKEAREEALSKYEALQSELKVKEERIDIQMDKLETEQNAIKTELDSLKNIIKENIDSTFKIFNA